MPFQLISHGCQRPGVALCSQVDVVVATDDEGLALFVLSDGTERQYPHDAGLWTLAPAQWVRSAVDDGRGFITVNDPTTATGGLFNRERGMVTNACIRTLDGTTATTLLLALRTFAGDTVRAEQVDVVL